jgi:YD repeat-containing protein
MTVAGQTAVGYSYDNANRLTGITQGSWGVSFAYDAANRRTSLTLPNGIMQQLLGNPNYSNGGCQ